MHPYNPQGVCNVFSIFMMFQLLITSNCLYSHQASQAQEPEVAPTQPEEVLLACHCVGV